MANVKMRGHGQGDRTAKALPVGKYLGRIASRDAAQSFNSAIEANRLKREAAKKKERERQEKLEQEDFERWEKKSARIIANRKFTDEQVAAFKRAAYARGKKSYTILACELGIKKHELIQIMTGAKYGWVK